MLAASKALLASAITLKSFLHRQAVRLAKHSQSAHTGGQSAKAVNRFFSQLGDLFTQFLLYSLVFRANLST